MIVSMTSQTQIKHSEAAPSESSTHCKVVVPLALQSLTALTMASTHPKQSSFCQIVQFQTQYLCNLSWLWRENSNYFRQIFDQKFECFWRENSKYTYKMSSNIWPIWPRIIFECILARKFKVFTCWVLCRKFSLSIFFSKSSRGHLLKSPKSREVYLLSLDIQGKKSNDEKCE